MNVADGVSAMSNLQDDLKATAEAMIDDSQRVKDLEKQKLVLAADDPRYVEIARQIEDLVARMAAKARAQTQIAEEALAE
jgi:hypothetical protein